MKAHWWSFVLGLLCLPSEVNTWSAVLQDPSHTSVASLDSSEITCSTTLSDPVGVYLNRPFHGQRNVLYLSLHKGSLTKNTTAAEFEGRIHITPFRHMIKGLGFTIKISPLQLEDTGLYYCKWVFFRLDDFTEQNLVSNETLLIFRDVKQCSNDLDTTLIVLTVAVLTVTVGAGAVMMRRRYKFKKNLRLRRSSRVTATNRIHHQPQHRQQNYPYIENAVDIRYIHYLGSLRGTGT